MHDQLHPPPLAKKYFATVRGLAKSPPTVHSNCSERMCLYARTFLVALENYSGYLGELFWLPWGIVLVGQGSRIKATQYLPDVRFLFLPPFAHACYLCREVNKNWQYRTGGNLTILAKIMTLRREADRKQRRSLRLPMEIKRTQIREPKKNSLNRHQLYIVIIANACAFTQGPFWLPWRIALVGRENQIEDVRFFLSPSTTPPVVAAKTRVQRCLYREVDGIW